MESEYEELDNLALGAKQKHEQAQPERE